MDRVTIVTGASRGLGRAIALRFGQACWGVLVNYREKKDEAHEVADKIKSYGGDAAVFKTDVRNYDNVSNMINEAMNRWGRIDVLINNAGITKDRLLIRMTEEDWDSVIDTNLKGTFNCVKAVSKIMMKQKKGHITNIASIAGLHGREGQANYSASKAGLIGLTKAAAMEIGRFNVMVNAVLPGYLPTDMGENLEDEERADLLGKNLLGRGSSLEEVAEFIYNLSLMEHVSGQVFNLDSRII